MKFQYDFGIDAGSFLMLPTILLIPWRFPSVCRALSLLPVVDISLLHYLLFASLSLLHSYTHRIDPTLQRSIFHLE